MSKVSWKSEKREKNRTMEARASRKSPASTATLLPNFAETVALPRRTSDCAWKSRTRHKKLTKKS